MSAHVVVVQGLPRPDRSAGRGERQIDIAVETFKLLGDRTRLKILLALLQGEHSVGDLVECVGANQPAVSQQLSKLRAARLVQVRRDGNRMFYTASDTRIRGLLEQAMSGPGREGDDSRPGPTPEALRLH